MRRRKDIFTKDSPYDLGGYPLKKCSFNLDFVHEGGGFLKPSTHGVIAKLNQKPGRMEHTFERLKIIVIFTFSFSVKLFFFKEGTGLFSLTGPFPSIF